MHLSRRTFLAGSLATLATHTLWADPAAPSTWEKWETPPTKQGLVLQPKLLTIGGRINLYWTGTGGDIHYPEIHFCSKPAGDGGWDKVFLPYYGQNLGRVRRLAVAAARNVTGMIFQRETNQGNGAVEVSLAFSTDFGFSFSSPMVIDSYVLGQEGGSSVSMGARQSVQRGEFAVCWIGEGGVVRVGGIDPRSVSRPSAVVSGTVSELHGKAEIMGAGPDGFYAVWPEEGKMRCARVKPLQGMVEAPQTLATGEFGRNFSVASYYRGPAFITAVTEAGQLTVLEAKDGKFVDSPKVRFPIRTRKLDSRTALENEKFIHMAILEGGPKPRIWHMTNRSGSWSEPKLVCDLVPDVSLTGFDIACNETHCYIVQSQQQLCGVYRMPFA